MASIILDGSQRNGMAFLSALGLARRTVKHGRSLTCSNAVAGIVANAYHAWIKETGKMGNKEDLEVFYKDHCKLRLAKDGNVVTGGYLVLNGTLMSLFSNVKGNGSWLVRQAMNDGAVRLDCFDGPLVKFYKDHGFYIERREPNWTEGGPDVVFMARTGVQA